MQCLVCKLFIEPYQYKVWFIVCTGMTFGLGILIFLFEWGSPKGLVSLHRRAAPKGNVDVVDVYYIFSAFVFLPIQTHYFFVKRTVILKLYLCFDFSVLFRCRQYLLS